MNAVIFAGPSLPPSRRPPDPRLIWKPPVKQGDLYRAALGQPAIIGVVDGYFETVPTVWHKEILWAMAQGIHVYGSASIGALRAAELSPFGMKGVGKIYEAFRDGILQDDDEVAVLHGPEELGYPALTEAMVNIRATLDAATADGILDLGLAGRLASLAKDVFYKDRTSDLITRLAAERGILPDALKDLTAWLERGRIDQKRSDAQALIAAIRVHLAAGVTPLSVSYRFHDTGYHHTAVRHAKRPSQNNRVIPGG
jgi:hypothetical protein